MALGTTSLHVLRYCYSLLYRDAWYAEVDDHLRALKDCRILISLRMFFKCLGRIACLNTALRTTWVAVCRHLQTQTLLYLQQDVAGNAMLLMQSLLRNCWQDFSHWQASNALITQGE